MKTPATALPSEPKHAPRRRPAAIAAAVLLAVTGGLLSCGPSRSLADPAGGASGSEKVEKMKTVLSKSGYDVTPLSREEVAVLAKKLSPESYRVTQKAGTEPPFCGNLLDNHKEGIYACVVCGLPLFSSEHKFNSGTGWPSFFRPIDPARIATQVDLKLGVPRTEYRCARCGGHQGHVFDDGPAPTGQRYCNNGVSLLFVPAGQALPPLRD